MKNDEVILEPGRGWLRIDWRELAEFRDLLLMLVWRDFTVKHRQTILGPAWLLLNPLLMTAVFTVVFGRIARIPTDDIPPILFYLCGLLGWNYFTRIFQQTSSTLISNSDVLTKVYFPRLILPLAAAVSSLIAFVIQLTLFAGIWGWFNLATDAGRQLQMGPVIFVLPLLLVHAAVLSLGVGLWFAALTVKYRDLLQVLGLLVQLWMYVTPVIYPLSRAPAGYHWLVSLNPMSPVVEAFRATLLGKGTVDPLFYALSVGVSCVALVTGIMIFQRTERTFVDII